jgi:predicted acylesterase/phospholipase RssA
MANSMIPINLVLGGGGAKGFAHVGVICELVERGFEISSIVGTSVGALIGALFAYNRAIRNAGADLDLAQKKAAEAVEQVCIKEDFLRFKDLNFRTPFGRGFFRGRRLEDWLKDHFFSLAHQGEVRFSDLSFDLTITATNALNGDEIVLNRKKTPDLSLHKAVRASTSIQGVYPDAEIVISGSSIRCWDGGTTGNCRFDIAHREGPASITWASSLTYAGDPRWTELTFLGGWLTPWARLSILSHSISILMRRLEDVMYEKLTPDERSKFILLRPDVGKVDMLDFGLSRRGKRELIDNGRAAVRGMLQTIPPDLFHGG